MIQSIIFKGMIYEHRWLSTFKFHRFTRQQAKKSVSLMLTRHVDNGQTIKIKLKKFIFSIQLPFSALLLFYPVQFFSFLLFILSLNAMSWFLLPRSDGTEQSWWLHETSFTNWPSPRVTHIPVSNRIFIIDSR